MKAKRKLKNFNITAIAVTDASQGGACSLKNDAILFKALKEGRQLTKEQKALLLELGHTESDIAKAMSGGMPQSSSSEDVGGEDNANKEKGTDKKMSDELLKAYEERVGALEKQLKVEKAEKEIMSLQFGDLQTPVAETLATLDEEGKQNVIKAFKFLCECSEYALAVEKSKVKTEENPLKKALEEENGVEGGEETIAEELTTLQKIEKELKAIQEQNKGAK